MESLDKQELLMPANAQELVELMMAAKRFEHNQKNLNLKICSMRRPRNQRCLLIF
jgi:hypothetical protein